MSLSTKAMLVCVKISQWGNRKRDKRASAAVESQFKAGKKAGGYNKKLLPGAKELERVTSLAGKIGDFFRDNTLPWLTDGTRILSSKNFIDFSREFQAKQIEFKQVVEDFLAVYPDLKIQAQKDLGDLFLDSDYPDDNTIRDRFQCVARFMPLPEVTDFRVEVSDDIKNQFLAGQVKIETEAVAHCFKELEAVIKKAVETLSNPNAQLRSGMLDSITRLCVMLPKLNVTDNPDLEATRREVEGLVSKIDPTLCRVNQTERQSAASKLKEIQDKMGAFMGAPSTN